VIYSPQQFTVTDRDVLLRLIRENSFATLIVGTGSDPMVAHIPVFMDEATDTLLAHVARANPLWQQLTPDREVLFVFHGPHHYVSPSWYTVHPSVPTWNYAVVHVNGCPTIIDDHVRVESMLRRLVDEHESGFELPWKMDLPTDFKRKMIDGVVAFEVRISRIQGKFKLSQNRPRVDRSRVIAALRDAGDDDATRLASLMQQVLEL